MQLMTAIALADNHEKIKGLRGYFLGSCFACIKGKNDKIDEWTLLYYNPSDGKAVDCFVNGKFVTVGSDTRTVKPVERMNLDEVQVGIEKALEIADERFGRKTIDILITLHHRKHMLWTINMITADMNATTYDIDAKTGEILREETTTLIHKF